MRHKDLTGPKAVPEAEQIYHQWDETLGAKDVAGGERAEIRGKSPTANGSSRQGRMTGPKSMFIRSCAILKVISCLTKECATSLSSTMS